ncbi:uncharacterized protein LACBIDRAFT_335837 [Laccaria bicolor S238N-H82]|uniref:Predicted protein n=1 Tax=Laccaria bicolor (strain S238N-H82 / ATCC MYA-4686) TaxID=486041 RepID=B0E3K5_LACBS|nr:uncharacterized protein LACBIDRAFT_335837 [Laccaria bicolor S238N-H82]EDQ98576.1 predicted protein [Laccaria bicolor S238N-H82]|eukprot:XP_001890772.1 predicted protein [Laccaria bicolor S238N-H82]
MTYFPCGLPSKCKVACKENLLCLDSPQRRLVWILLTSRKRSDKPFMNPSTLRGDLLCLDFLQRRLVWILPYVPKTLRQTVYESVNSSWRRSNKPFTNPSSLRGDLPVAQFPST